MIENPDRLKYFWMNPAFPFMLPNLFVFYFSFSLPFIFFTSLSIHHNPYSVFLIQSFYLLLSPITFPLSILISVAWFLCRFLPPKNKILRSRSKLISGPKKFRSFNKLYIYILPISQTGCLITCCPCTSVRLHEFTG